MEPNFYKEELHKMRKSYESDPLEDISLKRPFWMESTDPLSAVYTEKSKLLQKGKITFARIVQANTLLYRTFPPSNCPAHIVYSTDEHISENPKILQDIALRLYSFKDKNAEEIPDQWKEVARVITDEYDRSGFTFSIDENGQEIEYHMIPTMIHRKLLPRRKLCGMLLPIMTNPECKQVLILPKKYWSREFTNEWVKGSI